MRESRVVSIVLPNWNGAKLLKKHLPKVLAAAPGIQVIVVDDSSSDNSLEVLKNTFPTVEVIVKKHNSGFAQTVNTGVVHALGEIVVLLNTDVVPEKGFLTPLLKHFSDPSVFAVGCLEKNSEKEGVVLRGRAVAHWEKGFYIHGRGEVNKLDSAWASGGSAAFRKSTWNLLGGMDTIYSPFYWEDIDLSYRAQKAGFRIVFEPKARVWHLHEQGAIKTSFQQKRVEPIVFRNQFIFIWKNLTEPALWVSHMFWMPVRIVQEVARGRTSMLMGWILALGKIPQIITKRKTYAYLWKRKDKEVAVF